MVEVFRFHDPEKRRTGTGALRRRAATVPAAQRARGAFPPRGSGQHARGCRPCPHGGAQRGRHPYPPGQVEVEVSGAQEAQQEGVGERRGRSARCRRPAPQLRQRRLQQRRVVGQRAQLQPSRRPRQPLWRARRHRSGRGGPGRPEKARAAGHPPGPPPVAAVQHTPTFPPRRAVAGLAHLRVGGPGLPKGNHVVSPPLLIVLNVLDSNLNLTRVKEVTGVQCQGNISKSLFAYIGCTWLGCFK